MHTSRVRSTARHRTVVSLLVVTALLITLGGGVAWALPSQGELDAARQQARRLESAVANAEAELAEVRAQLEVLEGRLAEAQAKLEASTARYRLAEIAATAASDRARAAEAELSDATLERDQNRETLGELARDTYKYGAHAGSAAMAAFEMMDGPNEGLADRLHYLQRGVGVRTAALQAADALQVRVTHLTDRARIEEAQLRQRQDEAEAERVESATLHAEVEQLTSETSNKLERAGVLVATLESEQSDVEVRIRQLEEQVARERAEAERRERERRERERREREAREQAARERAEQERAERRRQERAATSSPGSPRGSSGSSRSSGGSPSTVSNSPGPNPSLRTVGGITVTSSLAPQLEALLNHARRDGIVLGGHGYRAPEVTARLRLINGCRDIHNAPASSCRVPTARPGSSQHEKGLAIDFTYQGQTICFPRRSAHCSGNAGFTWLRNHAGSYGLRNLPSEAWHWSTTGR